MNWFFIGDEHYGHANIIKFCKRPFANVTEMKEEMIARHNAKVSNNDITVHVGDFAWKNVSIQEASDILKRLNGMHHIVWGNHDETARRLQESIHGNPTFDLASDTVLCQPDPSRPAVWCSHYAHRVWPHSHKGSYHVYGHTHGALPDFRRSHDVGVDANNFTPVSYDELDALMKSKVVPPDEVELAMQKNKWKK